MCLKRVDIKYIYIKFHIKDRLEFLVANIQKDTKQQTPARPLQDMCIVDVGEGSDISIICAPLSPRTFRIHF